MSLTVLSVAYPLTPVGPNAVGGSEQILTMLDAALTRAGHQSIVIACGGSAPQGTLFATPRHEGTLTDAVRAWAQGHHRIAIEEALRKSGNVPLLATLHLPPHLVPCGSLHAAPHR